MATESEGYRYRRNYPEHACGSNYFALEVYRGKYYIICWCGARAESRPEEFELLKTEASHDSRNTRTVI